MNQTIYAIIITVITIIGSYFFSWWLIPTSIGILSFFYKGKILPAFTISFTLTAIIWMVLAYFSEGSSIHKPSVLTGQIFGNLPPFAIYLITGFIIGISSGLCSVLGKRLHNAFY